LTTAHLHWLNSFFKLPPQKHFKKSDAVIAELKKWVDAEYEGGRVTVLTEEELVSAFKNACTQVGLVFEEVTQ